MTAVCRSLSAATMCLAATAVAQNYPLKPVRVYVSDVGGGTDVSARMIAPEVAQGLGQQIIIENRGGVVTAAGIVAKAPADGYTLLYYGASVWLLPLMRKDVPYTMNEFAPITLVTVSPAILVVHPSLPVKNVKELIALAKANPGALNYASAATGTTNHLAAELLKYMAGINVVRVTYKGTGAALQDVISGHVQMTFAAGAAAASHVKAGRLRALAVTGAKPSPAYPGAPTVASSGLPGYEAVSSVGLFAPGATPAPVITRLNQEFSRVLNRTDIKDKFILNGVETGGGAPEQLAAVVKSEIEKMGKVIRAANIRDE